MAKVKRVVGIKGIKQYQMQHSEKPRHTTMLTCVNAAGFALPLWLSIGGSFMIPGASVHNPRVLVQGSKKDYINKTLFAEYGQMFIYHLHAADQLYKPNLLLMDSYYVHVFNYCFMQMMYSRDIKVFALEPHTSHWGQPLDKNPFLALKDAFNEGMHKFRRRVGGRSIQKLEFFSAFSVAWEKAMTSKNIKASCRRTGI